MNSYWVTLPFTALTELYGGGVCVWWGVWRQLHVCVCVSVSVCMLGGMETAV